MATERCSLENLIYAWESYHIALSHMEDALGVIDSKTRPAYSSAYNAIFHSADALMKLNGISAHRKEHHLETLEFLMKEYSDEISLNFGEILDNARRTRNYLQYNSKNTDFSLKRAKQAINTAKELLGIVEIILSEKQKKVDIII